MKPNTKVMTPSVILINTTGTKMIYVLQSIGKEATAVWFTETLPMPKIKADRVARERLTQSKGRRRYRLVPVDY